MTRGIKNNNPLNIRLTQTDWQGKRPHLTSPQGEEKRDPEFEEFISMYYGFRAAILTIETYIIKHGCNTIRAIINRWAPASDGNDTEHYISQVCKITGIGGNEVLSNYDKRIKRLVAAMARIESGENIKDYFKALDKAFDDFVPRVPAEKEPRKFYR